jgi:hypothetical protein
MNNILQVLKNRIYRTIETLSFTNKVRKALEDIYRINGQAALLVSRNSIHNSKNLWDYEVKVYSQWGEDGILDYLTEKLKIYKPKMLEIGVGDFNECNSRALVEFKNASAYLVDINENLEAIINNSELKWKTHLKTETSWVSPNNINLVVQNAQGFMNGMDIISLDIDGIDYWILKQMNIPPNVQIIVVEYNPIFGSKYELTVPFKENFDRAHEHFSHLYFGCSISAWIKLLEQRSYCFVGTNRVGNNAFFVKQNRIENLTVEPQEDLSVYTDWRIRESRDNEGLLNFLSGDQRYEIISEQPVVNLASKSVEPLRKYFNL